MSNHGSIHKLVWAIKALSHAEQVVTQASAIDDIRMARSLCWQVGEDLGIDLQKQLQRTEELG